jgi:hypothetical protein
VALECPLDLGTPGAEADIQLGVERRRRCLPISKARSSRVPPLRAESERAVSSEPGARVSSNPRSGLTVAGRSLVARSGSAVRATPRSEMVSGPNHRREEQGVKITYFVSSGTGDATRASIPLHLAANGSIEVGQQTSIVLGGDATELLLGDNADRVEGVGVPAVRDLLAKLRDHAVPVFV